MRITRRRFASSLVAGTAAAYLSSSSLARRALALPIADGIYGDVADALLDVKNLGKDLQYWTRYLTLSALPPDYDLESAYAGLSFWVNSLSTSAFIKPPRQVTKTLFAIDLRDYYWSIEAWDALTDVDGYYFLHGSLVLRADFFVYLTGVTTRSKSYYDFLYGFDKRGKSLAPKTAKELQDRFKIRLDDAKIVYAERGVPIKKHESGVVWNNRLIFFARTITGTYWQTLDTKTSAGNQNLPANLDLRQFKHDAGEIIFSLPNELNGFLLVDGNDKRIEIADGEVVKVPFLHNGARCVECHGSRGVITPKTFVPEWVQKAVDLDTQDPNTAKWFEAFYHADPQGIAFREAKDRYENAVVKCWSTAPGETVEKTAASIVAGFTKLRAWYQEPVGLKQACHELGYGPAQVQKALQEHKTQNVNLPALGADETYARDDWESNGFRQLRSILKKGEY